MSKVYYKILSWKKLTKDIVSVRSYHNIHVKIDLDYQFLLICGQSQEIAFYHDGLATPVESPCRWGQKALTGINSCSPTEKNLIFLSPLSGKWKKSFTSEEHKESATLQERTKKTI